jgi:hypothetical protein
MQIKINKTVQEVKDITLPAYRKNNYSFFKVISEDKCIQVATGYFLGVSRLKDNSIPFSEYTEESNEQEFLEALSKANEEISELIK